MMERTYRDEAWQLHFFEQYFVIGCYSSRSGRYAGRKNKDASTVPIITKPGSYITFQQYIVIGRFSSLSGRSLAATLLSNNILS
jgi:hypothetical protein